MKEKTDVKEELFSRSLSNANAYGKQGFTKFAISQLRSGRLAIGITRAWQRFRPTVIVARIFKWIFVAVTFIERSAILLAASAVALALLPVAALAALCLFSYELRQMRRVYGSIRKSAEAAGGVVVIITEREFEAARVSCLAVGRVGVMIVTEHPRGVCSRISDGVFVGSSRFFFYLRRRAEKDRLALWVIY